MNDPEKNDQNFLVRKNPAPDAAPPAGPSGEYRIMNVGYSIPLDEHSVVVLKKAPESVLKLLFQPPKVLPDESPEHYYQRWWKSLWIKGSGRE